MSGAFDGKFFSQSIIAVVLVALLIFGTRQLEEVTDAPSP
jgi:Sec-independent protein translocase protein TatA